MDYGFAFDWLLGTKLIFLITLVSIGLTMWWVLSLMTYLMMSGTWRPAEELIRFFEMDLSCLPYRVLHLVRCCLHTFLLIMMLLVESLVSRERSLHHVKSHPRVLQVRFGWQAKYSTTLNVWSTLNNGCRISSISSCTNLYKASWSSAWGCCILWIVPTRTFEQSLDGSWLGGSSAKQSDYVLSSNVWQSSGFLLKKVLWEASAWLLVGTILANCLYVSLWILTVYAERGKEGIQKYPTSNTAKRTIRDVRDRFAYLYWPSYTQFNPWLSLCFGHSLVQWVLFDTASNHGNCFVSTRPFGAWSTPPSPSFVPQPLTMLSSGAPRAALSRILRSSVIGGCRKWFKIHCRLHTKCCMQNSQTF